MNSNLLLPTAIIAILLSACKPTNGQIHTTEYVIPDSVCYIFDTIEQFSLLEIAGNVKDNKYPYYTDEFEVLYFQNVYQCENKEVLKLFLNTCQKMAKRTFNDDDTSCLMINRENALLSKYDSSFLKKNYLKVKDCSYLIPDFQYVFANHLFKSNANDMAVPVNTDVYVLKSDNSFILPPEYLFDWELLPEAIRHGYSSGIAFNHSTPTIIYSWAIAW